MAVQGYLAAVGVNMQVEAVAPALASTFQFGSQWVGILPVSVAGMESATQFDIAGETRNEPEALGVYSESFTDTEPSGVLFYDVFNAIAGTLKPAGQADAIPVRWLIIPVYLVILLVLSLLTYKGTRQAWLTAVVVAFGLGAAVPMGLWAVWVPTLFVILAFTVIGVKTWVL